MYIQLRDTSYKFTSPSWRSIFSTPTRLAPDLALVGNIFSKRASVASNVGLSYGLTILFSLVLTILIMTIPLLSRQPQNPKKGKEELDSFLKEMFNRPRGTKYQAVHAPSPKSRQTPSPTPVSSVNSRWTNISSWRGRRDQQAQAPAGEPVSVEDVQRCAALLREMYALDLRIWSMEGGVEAEIEAAKRQADGILREVRAMALAWEVGIGEGQLTAEQRAAMDEICRVLKEQPETRYS